MINDFQQINFDDSFGELSPNEPHMACVLLVDTSGSMRGNPIQCLNEGINKFINETSMDPVAQRRVDVAIIEFNSTVRVVQDFTPIACMKPIQLTAFGSTVMAQGIKLAIDKVKERTRFYNSMGTPCFKPWIFMITDGQADYNEDMEGAAKRIWEEENKGNHGKLKFFILGVSQYDKEEMFKLTHRVMELRDTDFSQIFDWMSESMVAISVSRVGEEPKLSLLPENARKADINRDISDW